MSEHITLSHMRRSVRLLEQAGAYPGDEHAALRTAQAQAYAMLAQASATLEVAQALREPAHEPTHEPAECPR